MAGYLIVNADDYGLTASASAGIRHAHLRGLVTSTTAMLNQPSTAGELEHALAECPELGLGVHLVLTKGRPLLPPAALPSLMRLGTGGDLPSLAQFHSGLHDLNPSEILAEWRSQVEAFMRATGRPPTHLDSHHHTAYLSPSLLAAFLSLAQEVGCAVRLPFTRHDPAQQHLGLPPEQLARVHSLGTATTISHPDAFDARFYGDPATAALLREILATLPPGVTELMCHPALPDDTLPTVTSYHHHRAQELAALTAPGLRALAAASGITLAHFGHFHT